MPSNQKYFLSCHACGHTIPDLKNWFDLFQTCPSCGQKRVSVHYFSELQKLPELLKAQSISSFWHYFDLLPLCNSDHIVSFGEGHIPVENWDFLSLYAREKYGLHLEVWAYRNDLNQGTGTFKDVAASMAASALQENGILAYCAASTGNIATSFARYLSKAEISFQVFIPSNALPAHVSDISLFGQKIFSVLGDYSLAKSLAAQFSKENHILLSGGNVDPMRVEGKKTQVFEWLRQKGKLPDVYIQALSGGTGPIAIEKACLDLNKAGYNYRLPRMLLVQPDGCDPMSQAWENARDSHFPTGFEKDYPIIENPLTQVPTLATGNPATYPILAPLVLQSGGEIFSVAEERMKQVARLVGFEKAIKIGPAAAIAVDGFFEALRLGYLREGETVMINIGEGANRAPEFLSEAVYSQEWVDSNSPLRPFDRHQLRDSLWAKLD